MLVLDRYSLDILLVQTSSDQIKISFSFYIVIYISKVFIRNSLIILTICNF